MTGLEDRFQQEWGEDALLQIEEDLEGLEEARIPAEDLERSSEVGIDQDTELEEWEELIDSQWVKVMD